MSHSYSEECPNCMNDATACCETRPFEHTFIYCIHCGFQAFTIVEYMDLDTLNSHRIDADLEVLKELPEQNFEL